MTSFSIYDILTTAEIEKIKEIGKDWHRIAEKVALARIMTGGKNVK
jgi:hypothetical protein